MNKIHLGKTATSRSRKKNIIEDVSNKLKLPQDDFTNYLLKKGYSNTTIESFLSDMGRFNRWLTKENIEIENIIYNDITSYLQSFGNIAQHTKGCYLRGVKKYFNFLVQKEERTDNPAEFIQLKGLKRKTLYDILNRQELDKLYNSYTLPDEQCKDKNQNWFKAKVLAYKRNKVILGLLVYQGLRVEEVAALNLQDLALREGKITIHSQRRTAGRTMQLESHQVYELMDYIHEIRKAFLTGDEATAKLFLQWNKGENFYGITQMMLTHLRKINSRIKNFEQIRASVITEWLKRYDLRKVQYLAGHKYVSSTENYKVNVIDGLQEDVTKYHPF